jgi:predicted acylesterase/phospholipase RssA
MAKSIVNSSKLRKAAREMEQAKDYNAWKAAAKNHDELSGIEDWKGRDNTSLYDSAEVRIRHDTLTKLIQEGNYTDLLYALNEGIHGNMGGMGRPVLYKKAKLGTKYLIDSYVSVIVGALKMIADAPEKEVSLPDKIDFFRRASHCYGRSALMMSGGAGLIYYHHGVVQTLINEDMLPNVLSGASAGSWMCAQIGTHSDEELKNGYFEKKIYDMPVVDNTWDFIRHGSSVDINESKQVVMDSFANDMTFQEAFEHTGRYINVTIAPAEKHQTSRLMNAITSPNVYIRSAIDASSAVPGLLPGVTLYAKGADGKPKPYLPTRKWVDGSFAEDLPAKRLARLYGVNHYLVSMINPAARFFTNESKGMKQRNLYEMLSSQAITISKDILYTLENRISKMGLAQLSPAILLVHAVLDQDYTGDINMILKKKDYKLPHIWFDFKNDQEIRDLILAGERDTWPNIPMIRNATIIGRTLDDILEAMDEKEFSDKVNQQEHLTLAT